MGCDPKNKEAVQRLLEIKQRPEDMGLILLGASIDGIESWIDISAEQKEIIEGKNSVPTTYLVPKKEVAPSWISGKHDSIAIRITQKDPVPYLQAFVLFLKASEPPLCFLDHSPSHKRYQLGMQLYLPTQAS